MAKGWAGATGNMLRFARTWQEEGQLGPDPTGTGFTFNFDETTNPTAVQDLLTDWNNCTAPGGVLNYKGVPVVINPPSQFYTDRAQIVAILQALAAGTATQAQMGLVLRFILRVLQHQGAI